MSVVTKVTRVDRQVTRVIRIPDGVTQVTRPTRAVVRVVASSPAGPRGPRGLPGAGATGFHFEQPADDPLSVWTIHHDRGAYPAVVLRDETGDLMFARWDYQDSNTITVSFPSPQAGTADLIF